MESTTANAITEASSRAAIRTAVASVLFSAS
jgi:hypothetical protein